MPTEKLSREISSLLITVSFMIFARPAFCQERGAEASSSYYVPSMKFDVASVRENKNIDPAAGITMGGSFAPNTTSLRLVNLSMNDLISTAYRVDQEQIVNSPKWPFPTLFMVEAKSDSASDAKMAALKPEQQRAEQEHMLQELLQERFSLKTHWDTREGDIYKLVVAKGGSKLSPAGPIENSAQKSEAHGDKPLPSIYQKNDGHGYDFIAHGCSIDMVVAMLQGQFGRPVIDETALTGKYDFVLKYKGRWDRDRDASDLDPMPPLDRALQEQLGLKVEGAKGPVKILVIDHVEKPSEN